MKLLRFLLVLAVLLAVIFAANKLFGKVPCATCDGTGQLSGTQTIQTPCSHCGQTGKRAWKLKRPFRKNSSLGNAEPLCLHCQGKGYTEEDAPMGVCPICNGSGTEKLYQPMCRRIAANWETGKQ